MDRELRQNALSQMCKTAAATRLYSKVMQKVAERRSTPSDAYMAGFCKAAEDAGIKPDELMKLAWTWGGVWDGITSGVGHAVRATGNVIGGAYGGIKNAITGEDGGDGVWDRMKNGAKSGWTTADEFQKALPGEFFSKDTAENLWSGVKSFGNGLGKGVASLPGLATGIISGAGGVLGGWIPGVGGDNSYWDNIKASWNAGQNFGDSLGIGDYDLAAAKRKFDTWQSGNVAEYMERNGMDPNNLSATDRLALFGGSMANFAGEALGTAVPGAGAGKGLVSAGSKIGGNVGKVMQGAGKAISGISNYKMNGPVSKALGVAGVLGSANTRNDEQIYDAQMMQGAGATGEFNPFAMSKYHDVSTMM